MAAVILASMANGQTATADAHSITPVECHELLANGDFETGDLPPWAAFGMVGMGPGRESEHGVQLGGADNAGGELLQPVGIPPPPVKANGRW